MVKAIALWGIGEDFSRSWGRVRADGKWARANRLLRAHCRLPLQQNESTDYFIHELQVIQRPSDLEV